MLPVRVIAGLGNPGPAYDGTRHNIGFQVVDALAAQAGAVWQLQTRMFAHTAPVIIAEHKVLLCKPTTFMNVSGQCIQQLCRFYRWQPAEVVVVTDEFQIPVGLCKLTFGGSSGGHNGLTDIINRLGGAFYRLRIGIGPRVKTRQALTDFVLDPFAADEQQTIHQTMPRVVDGLHQLVRHGFPQAANQLNQRILPE
jgi:peptidyl-tRNA hydrolase, PTH1 family